MRDLSARLDLCSINTATLGFQAPLVETIDAIAKAGFGGIAPWRREVEGQDVNAIARHIRDAGLKLSGYCRSTYITAATTTGFNANIESNRRALNDAATLGAPCFVMVVGSLPESSTDLALARAQVREGTALLVEHGRNVGVKIALEPLHPVYAADRSCLTSLSEALDICDAINDPRLGVCIDAYHVWWDPYLARDVARARGRILACHVCDWLVPTRDVLNDRGMMGDGVIDLRSFRNLIEQAGYDSMIEAEIFSAENWWKRSMAETLEVARQRFMTVV